MIEIETQLAQLECDTVDCRYKVPEGELIWGRGLIGYQCPKCTSNMLTEEDFLIANNMSKLLDIFSVDVGGTETNDQVFVDIKGGGVSLKYETGRSYNISGEFANLNDIARLGEE